MTELNQKIIKQSFHWIHPDCRLDQKQMASAKIYFTPPSHFYTHKNRRNPKCIPLVPATPLPPTPTHTDTYTSIKNANALWVLLELLFSDETKSLLCCDAEGSQMWAQLHQNLKRQSKVTVQSSCSECGERVALLTSCTAPGPEGCQRETLILADPHQAADFPINKYHCFRNCFGVLEEDLRTNSVGTAWSLLDNDWDPEGWWFKSWISHDKICIMLPCSRGYCRPRSLINLQLLCYTWSLRPIVTLTTLSEVKVWKVLKKVQILVARTVPYTMKLYPSNT